MQLLCTNLDNSPAADVWWGAPFTASMQAGEQRSPANRLAMSVWVPQLPELVMAAWKAARAGGGNESEPAGRQPHPDC